MNWNESASEWQERMQANKNISACENVRRGTDVYLTMATNYAAWCEFFDTVGEYSENDFNQMTTEDKIELITGVLGPEDEQLSDLLGPEDEQLSDLLGPETDKNSLSDF